MADRMKALAALGVLTEEATARGDLRAVERLSLVLDAFSELIGLASLTETRRRADRERKRPPPRNSTDDRNSAESEEIHGIPRSGNFASSELPRSTTTTHHTPPRARARAEVVVDDLPPETRIALDGLRKGLGGQWASVERFLQRRNASTFPGWIHEMLKLIAGGSQFTGDDLAQTCDDDAALERPIGSPYALRKFLQKTRTERLSLNGNGNHADPADAKPRRRPAANNGGARNDETIDAAVARMEARNGKR